MESRMERYDEVDINDYQRSKKNATLYKEIYGNYSDLEDLTIPENNNEIEGTTFCGFELKNENGESLMTVYVSDTKDFYHYINL